MEKKSLLMMDRLMLNNKGFTLIETLFVISILTIMLTFSISIRPFRQDNQSIISDISLFLLQAKTSSMIYKEKVEIEFDDNQIQAISSHFNETYILSDGYFSSHSFSYNKQGHIVNPKTIYVYLDNMKYKFVYQIGAGCFYVE